MTLLPHLQPLIHGVAKAVTVRAMRQADRAIDWQRDDTLTGVRKIHAADGAPGVSDTLFGAPCTWFLASDSPRRVHHFPRPPPHQARVTATGWAAGGVWAPQLPGRDPGARHRLHHSLGMREDAGVCAGHFQNRRIRTGRHRT